MNERDAAQVGRRRPLLERFLRRVISVLSRAGLVVLAAFGTYFSFANYPAFGIAVVLSILLLIGYAERSRRARERALARVRRRDRRRGRDPSNG
jgi:heme exporter protein D